MTYLDTYCKAVADKKNVELSESIRETADKAYNLYLHDFSFLEHKVGLLFGNVQSGKTGQMLGIIARAADEGFAVFLVLTTDSNVLYEQTLERISADLPFVVCGEKDAVLFRQNELVEPCVVVLKKNTNVLKEWRSVFLGTDYMRGNPLFILDDEADAASLNTMVNKKRQSTINKYLSDIKGSSSSSIFLQVTGTPQALLLQTQLSGWHPDFIQYFQPGKGYLGGDFYFSDNAECIRFIDDIENPVLEAVIRHLEVSSILFSRGKNVSNCIFHPSVRQSEHDAVADEVKSAISFLKHHQDKLSPSSLPLLDSAKVLVLNGKHDTDSSDYAEGCNFVVGGTTLGRGVTFPQLQTVVYTRSSKQPQADTMWQHSRMFGYDRDAELMTVFIEKRLYKLFRDINTTNNALIAQIERGVDSIRIYYPQGLNPTRKNVLDKKRVSMIAGGTNYYPLDPEADMEKLDGLLEPFDGDMQVSLRLIDSLLSHITPSPDFRMDAFRSALHASLAEKPSSQGRLIVRRGRKVSQGTGALLSASDFKLSSSYKCPVLTMYRIEGGGWKQDPIWVPNIKLSDGVIFYDVQDEEL